MRKLIVCFFAALLLVLSPSLASAQEGEASPIPTPTSSYELFYPIVAGKVAGDTLYPLKLAREWVVGKLVFDPIRKADYHLVLSKKRLVETEKLLFESKDYKNAEKSIERFVSEYEKAYEIAKDAESKGKPTVDLLSAIKDGGTKEINFLRGMIENLEDNEKTRFLEAASSFEDILTKISS